MSGSSTAATGARDRKQLRDQLSLVAKRIALCIGDAPRDTVHSRLRRNEPLAAYTTFRIGGPADLFFEATTADELANAILAARELDVPYFVLGLGANILVGDRGVRGLVIRNHARHFRFTDEGRLWVESGATIAEMIKEAIPRGWSGLEHYVGIPSTIGGAV